MRFIISLFFSSIVFAEQFLIFTYKEVFLHNKLPIQYDYYYKKNLHNLNLDLYISNINQKKSSISIYQDYYLKDMGISLQLGDHFLNPFWNQLVFLTYDFGTNLHFPIKRRLKGIYISFWVYNLFSNWGFFSLEDQSKGIYFFHKQYLFLFDFYNKNFTYFHHLKSRLFRYYANLGGIKKDLYGFASFKYTSDKKKNSIQLFVMRNPLWDKYDYFLDNYELNKKFPSSFLSNLAGNYSKIFLNFNYFQKGNVVFTKSSVALHLYSFKDYNIKTGYNQLQTVQERSYRHNSFRYFLEIHKKSHFDFNTTYEWNPFTSLIKLFIGKTNKNIHFYTGFAFFEYRLKQIQKSHDFFVIYLDDTQIKNYLIERDYIAIFSELSYKTTYTYFYLSYSLENKMLKSSNKFKHNLDIKWSMKFL